MQIVKSLLFLSFAIIIASCNNSSSSVDPLLQEAFDYHMEAMDVEKVVRENLEKIKAKKNSIEIQGRALTEEEMDFLDSGNRAAAIYEIWTNNRIEVPGFEHEHDHSHEGHDHHHHHHHGNTKVKLTPQQMMEVQRESLTDIKNIAKQLEGLL